MTSFSSVQYTSSRTPRGCYPSEKNKFTWGKTRGVPMYCISSALERKHEIACTSWSSCLWKLCKLVSHVEEQLCIVFVYTGTPISSPVIQKCVHLNIGTRFVDPPPFLICQFITFVVHFHYKQCWTTSNITKNSIRDRYKPISKNTSRGGFMCIWSAFVLCMMSGQLISDFVR